MPPSRGSLWIESIVADLTFGLRHFRKRPVTTATMILLLAMGVGINTGIFTILHSLRTMPPPAIARNERLVRIRGTFSDSERREVLYRGFTFPEMRQYAEQSQLFSDVAGNASDDVLFSLGAGQNRIPVDANFVTSNFFRVLGVRPILGAGLPVASAEGEAPVAVIDHMIWQQQFGRSPDVIGKTIRLNDVNAVIVGVTPEGFHGAWNDGGDASSKVWLPVTARSVVVNQATIAGDSTPFAAVALLRPGTRIEQTIPAVQSIARRVAEQNASRGAAVAYSADVVPLLALNAYIKTGGNRTEDLIVLGVFTVIGLLILVITCTSVSTLLIGLATARRQEIAIRLSLGAARWRLVRQLVTESVLLATAGGLLAVGILWTIYRAFDGRLPAVQLTLDWTVLGFAFGLAVGTGILFGTSPALHATRLGVADVLKNAAGSIVSSRSRLQAGLVIVQIACTQPMLVGLGIPMMAVLERYRLARTPALSHNIVVAEFNPDAVPRVQAEAEWQKLRERLSALPGVVGVTQPSLSGGRYAVVLQPSEGPARVASGEPFMIRPATAAPGYFAFFDRRILHGRDFNAYDADHGHPAILDASTARRLFGPANPIGRRVARADQAGVDTAAMVIVGVVEDSAVNRRATGDLAVYVPGTTTVLNSSTLLIRTGQPAAAIIPQIRSVAQLEAPYLLLESAQTQASLEAHRRAETLQVSIIAGALGLVALFLSTIGLYSIVAFAVSQRTHEIGIRTALGATRRDVVGLFFSRGVKLGLIGLVIGLPLGILVVRLLSIDFLESFANAAVLSGMIAAVVLAVTAMATWIPARRAAGVDPLRALRAE